MSLGRMGGRWSSGLGVRCSSIRKLPPWAMPEAPIGVRKIKCKDDSNHLRLVRFLEIQLSRGSKRVHAVRNGKKIKAPTDSIIFSRGREGGSDWVFESLSSTARQRRCSLSLQRLVNSCTSSDARRGIPCSPLRYPKKRNDFFRVRHLERGGTSFAVVQSVRYCSLRGRARPRSKTHVENFCLPHLSVHRTFWRECCVLHVSCVTDEVLPA